MEDAELTAAIAERLDGRSVACAESCTAGRVASVLAGVEKASEWFRGGLVAYQVEVKRSLLGVEAPAVINERAGAEMAAGAARLFGADVTVATTGVAGDEPEEGVPPGTVVIATSVDGICRTRVHHFDADPVDVCELATHAALEDLLNHVEAPGLDGPNLEARHLEARRDGARRDEVPATP